jgi:tRNA(Ile)-lysidine synthase
MIKVMGKIPNRLILACSGGPDSMAALHFLSRSPRTVIVANFNHGTEFGSYSQDFLKDYCKSKGYCAPFATIDNADIKGYSKEEYWRNKRYEYFCNLNEEFACPIITCHHLDDQVEQYLFSTLNGKERLIPYCGWGGRVLRPFLLTRKADFVSWCDGKDIPYLIDPSNDDVSYNRNFIRHVLIPSALNVNPGLHKVVAKKVRKEFSEWSNDL